MKRFTLRGFLNLFSSQSLVFDSSGESSFKLDFSKESLKEKGYSSQSSRGISSLILLLILFLFSNFLSAQINVDGNPTEWGTTAPLLNGYKHVGDPFGNGVVDSQFTNGSKDFFTAANLTWAIGQTKAKNDICNAATVVLTDPSGTDGNGDPFTAGTYLFFAGDRSKVSGDAQIGFWYNLDGTAPEAIPAGSTTAHFSPPHVGTLANPGDILVLADFTGGGNSATVTVYQWVGEGNGTFGSNLSLIQTTTAAHVAENNIAAVNVPSYGGSTWPSNPNPALWYYPSTTYPVNAFYEGYVNLTNLIGAANRCNSSFLLECRSSQSLTASLDDFVGGSYNLTPAPPVVQGASRCGAGALTLTATCSTGSESQWYTAPTGGNPIPLPTSFTETTTLYVSCRYTAPGSAFICESARVPVTATINPNPNVNAGADKVLTCTTTSIALEGSSTTAGATFTWVASDGGNIVSGANTATPTVNHAGTYTLTVTDPSNGCTATDFALVTLNNTPPNVDAGADKVLTCTTTSISLSGSSTTAGALFSWVATNGGVIVSGGTTATPVVNHAGTYTLTVTDPSNGCTATDFALVTLNNTPPEIKCPDPDTAPVLCGATQLIAQNDADTKFATWFAQAPVSDADYLVTATYLYSPTAATPSPEGTSPLILAFTNSAITSTDVTVIWTIKNRTTGCENSCSSKWTLQYDCNPGCNTEPTPLLCNGDKSGTIKVTVGGGTPPYNAYLFISPDLVNQVASPGTGIAEGGSYTFTGLAANDNYVVLTTDAVSTLGSENEGVCNASVTEPTALEATDASTKATCEEGKDGTVTLTFSGGTPPYMVSFNGGVFEEQTSTKEYSGLAVGTYDWTVKDAHKCSVSGSEDVGFTPCAKALCTYTQGYYGNTGGMSCAEGVPYTTYDLINKALMSYPVGTDPETYKMTIGSPGHSVWMTNSKADIDAIISVLPGGGSSYVLPAVDKKLSDIVAGSPYLKKGNINNTLLAQTITLGLNLGINSELGNFALKAGTLATAAPDGGCGTDIPKTRSCSFDVYTPTINEYKYVDIPAVVDALEVKTVKGLFDLANFALGGGTPLPGGVTLSNLANAVDVINNAFDGCRISMGYDQIPLTCIADRAGFIVSPNPILDYATITYQFSYISDVTIEVYDMGADFKYYQTDYNTSSCLGKQVLINYPFTTSGTYIIKITTNIGSSTQTVVK